MKLNVIVAIAALALVLISLLIHKPSRAILFESLRHPFRVDQ